MWRESDTDGALSFGIDMGKDEPAAVITGEFEVTGMSDGIHDVVT
jgi:hypothetical protein